MAIPEFHNFREACQCLHDGGMIYRFGSNSLFYNHGGITWRGKDYYGVRSDGFTIEEQTATDWVLVSPEERQARDERLRKMSEEIIESNYQAQLAAERKVRESSIWYRIKKMFFPNWDSAPQ